ncbi:myb family transcription factor PHL8-like [Salvia splendens]|uniref:myb family transcription factor PHL8-like n=1 Tax=Salvia splendens TaxID=180675 RepID=UPI001C272F75|nr:myb family transcription factor PHL8-like [Salvia splendens]
MALHNQDMNLVLSSDAKPRLKWTPQLHRRFVDAVKQLGGPEKATPKSLMRVMGIQGLTLYHLKSHLQKYRLGRSHQSSSSSSQSFHHESREKESSNIVTSKKSNAEKTNDVQVAEALKMQMEVQRKLHQQIEVQKHLQLRMEAQGRYLQSVLKKAEETLSGYRACSIEAEHARAQLSHLASMVDSGCTTSVMTDSDASILADKVFAGCSFESSLTSSETSHDKGINDNPVSEKRKRDDIDLNRNEFDSGHRPRGIDLNSDGTF